MSGTALRAAALARLPALRLAYPQQFRAITPGRLQVGGLFLAGTLLLGFGIWRLQVDPARLISGFGQLLHFLGLMLPPDPGSTAQLLAILHALAETLAIAFLGTCWPPPSPCRSACWRRATPPSTASSASPPAVCWTASAASMR